MKIYPILPTVTLSFEAIMVSVGNEWMGELMQSSSNADPISFISLIRESVRAICHLARF